MKTAMRISAITNTIPGVRAYATMLRSSIPIWGILEVTPNNDESIKTETRRIISISGGGCVFFAGFARKKHTTPLFIEMVQHGTLSHWDIQMSI